MKGGVLWERFIGEAQRLEREMLSVVEGAAGVGLGGDDFVIVEARPDEIKGGIGEGILVIRFRNG